MKGSRKAGVGSWSPTFDSVEEGCISSFSWMSDSKKEMGEDGPRFKFVIFCLVSDSGAIRGRPAALSFLTCLMRVPFKDPGDRWSNPVGSLGTKGVSIPKAFTHCLVRNQKEFTFALRMKGRKEGPVWGAALQVKRV